MEPTRRYPSDSKRRKALPGCLLYVCAGGPKDQGRSIRLEPGPAVVGRDEECDLQLFDANVSRKHVRLSVVEDGIRVEDLGSTNGVLYLGKRIEKATLSLGARIGLGDCSIDLLPLPESISVPVSDRESYAGMVGISLPMRRLYSVLEMLENSDAPVLIEGQTGTGKEMVARALHDKGLRSKGPFVIIDCGNVPPDLMESELFGHRKGAFTGASADRAGAFEQAHGGTVFLDELGELPLPLQPKLLRVLETGQVKRLGDTGHATVDVRVVAATKRHLAAEVAEGRFRDDLFYRVAVVELTLPPLKERREDIPVLARHLMHRLSHGKVQQVSASTEAFLMTRDWPGNVRELRNVLQRILAFQMTGTGSGSEVIGWSPERDAGPTPPAGYPPPLDSVAEGPDPSSTQFRQAREQALAEFERAYLSRLWADHQGNLSAAARAAGIDRKYLRTLLRKHGII